MASQSPEILGYRFAFGGGEVAERATADCTGKHFEMRREASEMIITPNHAFDSGGCRGACAEEPVMARPNRTGPPPGGRSSPVASLTRSGR